MRALLLFALCIHAFCCPEIENIFRFKYKMPLTQNWLGADAFYNVKLSDKKALVFYGDTFTNDGTYQRQWKNFISNSVAVAQKVGSHWKYTYYTGKELTDFFPHPKSHHKYWPKDAFVLNDEVYVNLLEVEVLQNVVDMNFASRKVTLAKIKNPQASPENWQVEYIKLKHPENVYPGNTYLREGEYLYSYDVVDTQDGVPHRLLLSRLHLSELQGSEVQAEYLTEQGWQKIDHFTQAKVLFDHAPTEMSVSYYPNLGKYVMVQGDYNVYTGHVYLRVADSIEGPWDEKILIHQVPELDRNNPLFDKFGFTYAAKEMHYQSDKNNNRLTFAYIYNRTDPERSLNELEMVKDNKLYNPRFITIDLEEILKSSI